jgi:hypothetical protein
VLLLLWLFVRRCPRREGRTVVQIRERLCIRYPLRDITSASFKEIMKAFRRRRLAGRGAMGLLCIRA